jgi:hypothetical protein
VRGHGAIDGGSEGQPPGAKPLMAKVAADAEAKTVEAMCSK